MQRRHQSVRIAIRDINKKGIEIGERQNRCHNDIYLPPATCSFTWHWVKHRSHSNTGIPRRKFQSSHVEAVRSLSPGTAKVLNAMLASYGIMPTVRTFNNSMYDRLGESPSKSGVWKCLACDNLNLTTNSLRSLDSYETSNPYEPLDTSKHSNISFSRIQTSTTTFFFF